MWDKLIKIFEMIKVSEIKPRYPQFFVVDIHGFRSEMAIVVSFTLIRKMLVLFQGFHIHNLLFFQT